MSRRRRDSQTSTAVTSRRRLLAAIGGGSLTATAGCARRVRSLVTRDAPKQVSLKIKTVPADDDPRATRIARYLAEKLDAVGIAAEITPMSHQTLYRDVLLNQEFDLYVGQFFEPPNPDFLRPLFHSRFAAEPGWQNPFGYANLDVDELLDRQRHEEGKRRRQTLTQVQRSVARDQPLSVIVFPDEIRAVSAGSHGNWKNHNIHSPLGYLGIGRSDTVEQGTTSNSSDGMSGQTAMRMTLTDSRPTENLNPLAPEFRADGTIVNLLYDPLGRWVNGEIQPWMAASWNWTRPPTTDGPKVTVRLREDLTWHDGTPITAEDVAFTYRFLPDTSLGRLDSPIPAPRFRGASSLVTDVEIVDDTSVRLTLDASTRAVAARCLTVPILPAHIWEEKTAQATVAGVDINGAVTQALVWPNVTPVGSGPLQFKQRSARESLTFSRNDEHFLTRDTLAEHLSPYAGGFALDQLSFIVTPSSDASVELIQAGEADATASGVMPDAVPKIGRSANIDLRVNQPQSFYHLGYNVRQEPLSSPRFRRAVSQLLDKAYLTNEIFMGYSEPAASPLARHDALASALAWTGEDPELPFPGKNGTLDIARARKAFREAGYRYSEDGKLLAS